METLTRITRDSAVMGGKPCIRGMRVTVGTTVGLLAAGHSEDEILGAYPYLERDDIREALSYAVGKVEEIEAPCSRQAQPGVVTVDIAKPRVRIPTAS